MKKAFNLQQAYRLPWTKSDNPNGWIEVTTYCQLKCPGCYRGLAEDNPTRKHDDFDNVKSDIDRLIRERNIQTLSIAGGEPLMYPHLTEVVSYAINQGLETKVFTNGLALSENRLRELKNAGLGELIIHVDKFQERRDMVGLSNTNNLRYKFCEMFRKVGGINLGFILPVSGDNFQEASEAIDLSKRNSDVVSLMVFTTYKDTLPQRDTTFRKDSLRDGSMQSLAEFVGQKYNSKPCAYLGKINDRDTPSWLFTVPLFMDGEVIGHVDGSVIKSLEVRHKDRTGKYFFAANKDHAGVGTALPFILNRHYVPIIGRVVKRKILNPASRLKPQVVLIIDGPAKENGIWNLCDGCPDAMYHEGKLVPSCLLERIKAGEDIVTV